MSAMVFGRATKRAARLRLALVGVSGSGKTWTALTLASALGARIAVIDTERGSASKYADAFAFDVLDLDDHDPATYIQAIRAAESQYDVVVIDSLSHAWNGRGGALEKVDNAAKRGGNSYTAWSDVTPLHNALVDTIVACKAHVIATMRAKSDYVLEEDSRGKKVPRKVGMAPIQRDGMEYEFDVVASMDLSHTVMIEKTRCHAIDGRDYARPGRDSALARALVAWVSDGAAPAHPSAPTSPPSSEPSLADDIASRIAECADDAALRAVAADIASARKASAISDADVARLRAAYAERRAALAARAVEATHDAEPPEDAPPMREPGAEG